ncbi:enoyl-CoA hydratase/isomerase family protein [Mycolicibacterium helvum]|uniref:Enoyl-CoA hydratase n=1 Tax=Mycolicibacterium helvum TaxID=1534349 RepID=A0A7I7T1K0_9MYCO|nr:enoyl-CoA hydratase/isomerase family protein [Mycolicibacterium helvum]BBY62105.1 enoyl-CoA hydratase [Mycolicibacterium helvum]
MAVTRLEFDGPLAVLSLTRPGGNRISFAMRDELNTAVHRIAGSGARALLVDADGPDFCLGGDVRDWVGVPTDELRPRIEVLATALAWIGNLDIPTVAAVQGHCAGGGFEIALSCDMIIAARSARFSSPEALLGITTLQGGMLDLATRLGRTRAAELVFLSTPISAEQLCTWNLVNTVVDDDALAHAARDLAGRLAAGPTRAYAATKQLWRLQSEVGERAARRALYDTSMPVFDSRDAQAGLQAAAQAVDAGRPFSAPEFEGQ